VSARLLVFGARGQVARALAADTRFAVTLAGREAIDLAAPDADVAGVIAAAQPDAVINAAAYTAVDAAEIDVAACERLNRDAPAKMAAACAAHGVPLVHFSTDYVFDGDKRAPYAEDDGRAPINVYGRSKAEGEAALEPWIEGGAPVAIVRSSWIFSGGGTGFVGAMLRAAAERDEVSVVADQFGSPTSAADCADAALLLAAALLDREPAAAGVFHAASSEVISRAGFAEAIFALTPLTPQVRRVTTADFPTPARRPRDTSLASRKLEARFSWRAPPLGEALDVCVREYLGAR
jgi:dTDP-4-dehydrorhamnose reductase